MMAGAAGGGGSNSGFKILETNDAMTSNDNAMDLGITTSQDLSHDLAKLVFIGVVAQFLCIVYPECTNCFQEEI